MTNSEVSTSVISDDHMESVFIIIIIKKVKIIVTFSIKNTAGALYKSQIKGDKSQIKGVSQGIVATYVRWGGKFYNQTTFMIVNKQLAKNY